MNRRLPNAKRTSVDFQGGGILQDGFNRIFVDRPKVLNDLLEAEGDQIVTKVEVCRNPIKGIYENLLNVFTFGQLKRMMKEKGYDNLFHLYMILTLENGKVFSFEKNERVNVIVGKKIKPDSECMPPLIYGKETLREFIVDAENKKVEGFYRYDSFKDNCQKWVRTIMNANGITQFDNFISQDVEELAPRYIRLIARGITDIAGVLDFIKKGGEFQ